MENIHKNPAQGVKLFKKRTIRLEAGSSYTMGLGTYAAIQSESNFIIEVNPDMDSLFGASLEMIAIPGSDRFMGLYHLHNFGDEGCDVTILRRTIEDSDHGRA